MLSMSLRCLIIVVALVSCTVETLTRDNVTTGAALSPDPCELVSSTDVELLPARKSRAAVRCPKSA